MHVDQIYKVKSRSENFRSRVLDNTNFDVKIDIQSLECTV